MWMNRLVEIIGLSVPTMSRYLSALEGFSANSALGPSAASSAVALSLGIIDDRLEFAGWSSRSGWGSAILCSPDVPGDTLRREVKISDSPEPNERSALLLSLTTLVLEQLAERHLVAMNNRGEGHPQSDVTILPESPSW